MLAANLTLEKLKVKNSWRAHLHKLKSLVVEGKRNGSGRRRFFILRAEPHVPMWLIFIHQRQKIMSLVDIFLGFPNPLKPKFENSQRLKIRNWVPSCSARKRKNHDQKKLSETWIDSRFFSFSTVDNRQRISAPCSKNSLTHF